MYGFCRGFINFDDKLELLANYKCAIVLENGSQPHYISEKITDCWLTHTYPIYLGSPNLDNYYPDGSALELLKIPKRDWVKRIQQTVSKSSDQFRKENIKIARDLYLQKYSIQMLISTELNQVNDADLKFDIIRSIRAYRWAKC